MIWNRSLSFSDPGRTRLILALLLLVGICGMGWSALGYYHDLRLLRPGYLNLNIFTVDNGLWEPPHLLAMITLVVVAALASDGALGGPHRLRLLATRLKHREHVLVVALAVITFLGTWF